MPPAPVREDVVWEVHVWEYVLLHMRICSPTHCTCEKILCDHLMRENVFSRTKTLLLSHVWCDVMPCIYCLPMYALWKCAATHHTRSSTVSMATTHCNTLQHTERHCNTLQHTATHCTVFATHYNTQTLQDTATHCNILQHTATHCNTTKHAATHCNTLQHTATHCNTLRHTPRRKRGAGAHLQLQQCTQQQLQQHPSLPVPTCSSVDICDLGLGFRVWVWNS